MKRFCEAIKGFQPLTVFTKHSIVVVTIGSKYGSETSRTQPKNLLKVI